MSTTTSLRSCDLRLPLWLRLVALAVERAEPDLLGMAARFKGGEVRDILRCGGFLSPQAVNRAIRRAESHGLLVGGSTSRCLRIVPGSLTTGVES